jgi:hypothetical protein
MSGDTSHHEMRWNGDFSRQFHKCLISRKEFKDNSAEFSNSCDSVCQHLGTVQELRRAALTTRQGREVWEHVLSSVASRSC